MNHNFNEIIDRRSSGAKKYDLNVYAADVLPMWIADTDFRCPQPLLDAITKRTEHGIFGYPCNQNSFNDSVKKWMKERFTWDIKPEYVQYAPGVMPGIMYALRALSHPGDKVVINTPLYPPIQQIIENNGRRIERNELLLQNGRYEIDFAKFEKQVSDVRCKIFILCNPHNPGGRVFTKEELTKMGELCLKHNVFVLADEIHMDIVYKNHKHIPFGSISEAFAQNSISYINPSKLFNTAGFRSAAFICPNKKIREDIYEAIVNNKAYGRTVFGTLSLETCYNECGYYADQFMEYVQKNMEYTEQYFIAKIPRLKLMKPDATYLMWIDCSDLKMNQADLVSFFKNTAKIGLNDGMSFGVEGKGFMRLNIAVPITVLQEGLERIEKAINNL